MHEKRKEISLASVQDQRRARTPSDLDVGVAVSQVEHIEAILSTVPAEIISRRAIESQSYARALFYWERFMRQANHFETTSVMTDSRRSHFQRLQDIYTQIDEPDSIEGISSHLGFYNIEQQILEDRKAGRWDAVQTWYDLRLRDEPDNREFQIQFLNSLKASGRYGKV